MGCKISSLSKHCAVAVRALLALPTGFADKERAAVIGGSHGGFLTGHLMGQHPERFRCVLFHPMLEVFTERLMHKCRALGGFVTGHLMGQHPERIRCCMCL